MWKIRARVTLKAAICLSPKSESLVAARPLRQRAEVALPSLRIGLQKGGAQRSHEVITFPVTTRGRPYSKLTQAGEERSYVLGGIRNTAVVEVED
jgi:hypothetical protein